MKIVHILIIAATVALSGCSALKHNVKFEQPTEGPRARIRVVVPAVFNGYRGVRAFPNRDCLPDVNSPGNGNIVASQFGFEENLTGQKIDMPETLLSAKEDTKQAEIFVTAGQPIVFHYKAPVIAVGTSEDKRFDVFYHCALPVSFIPEAGADYELEFVDYDTSCVASLLRLDALPTPLRVKRVDNCVGRRRSLFQFP
jgi:hypothetical protein